jgi:predicted DNA-binding ribbon-helix-helix protein
MMQHTEELKAMAEKHNMTVEELKQHLNDHESMAYPEIHKILLNKSYSDAELEVMAKEHNMSLEQMKEHIAMAQAHHP